MNEYSLGQTVYYIEYLADEPYLRTFLIAAIRQTDAGYQYSQYENAASPYVAEADLFETAQLAIDYQIALLNALVPV